MTLNDIGCFPSPCSLDISHCTGLQMVDLSGCEKPADLKLPANSHITQLDVYNTKIAELEATSPLPCKTIIFVFFDRLLIFAIGTL